MSLERIKKFFTKEENLAISKLDEPSKCRCIGYLGVTNRFQFTTFMTDSDKERIMKDLQSAGFSIVGVMDSNQARELALIDLPFSGNSVRDLIN